MFARLRPALSSCKATPRVYLFFPAIVLKLVAAAVSGAAFVENSGVLWVSGACLWIVWFGFLWLIALPGTDDWLRCHEKSLRAVAVVLLVALLLAGIFEAGAAATTGLAGVNVDIMGMNSQELLSALDRSFVYNDATALCHQAVENLRAGLNPYANANIVLASLRFGIPLDRATPLRIGRFADDFPYPSMAELNAVWVEALRDPQSVPPEIESRLAYPAGCFLLPLPFLVLGMGDLRWVYLLLLLPVLAFVVMQAKGSLRWWLGGGLLVSLEIWNSIAAGETGVLVVPFLLLAWVLMRRNLWVAALCLGLAAATKQIAWFFVPFFLILVLRTMGLKKAVLAAGMVGAAFFALNAPFIIMDARLWVSSVLAPMGSNIFPLGVGLISLVTGGYWHLDNALLFGVMEVAVGLICVVWYYFNCRRVPHTALVLAVVPLLFAWRSLWAYFFYLDVILIAAVIINEYGARAVLGKAAAPPNLLAD
ncbi:MAG: hypothetical protein FWH51_06510 [Dehalococcoidia bacterium]|nr:hypothetical protein [Dehalococcoidia bacterium]